MKKSMRKIVFVIAMVLLVCLSLISGTYARYTWKGTATGTITTAKWQVGLGTEQTVTADVDFEVSESTNVATGKIAPGNTATGKLVINPNGSEVSVEYKLKIDDSNLSSDISIKIASVKVGTQELTADADGAYEGTITLTNNEALTEDDSVEVSIDIEWEDDTVDFDSATYDATGYGTNNDTTVGVTPVVMTIPVEVYMQQLI